MKHKARDTFHGDFFNKFFHGNYSHGLGYLSQVEKLSPHSYKSKTNKYIRGKKVFNHFECRNVLFGLWIFVQQIPFLFWWKHQGTSASMRKDLNKYFCTILYFMIIKFAVEKKFLPLQSLRPCEYCSIPNNIYISTKNKSNRDEVVNIASNPSIWLEYKELLLLWTLHPLFKS